MDNRLRVLRRIAEQTGDWEKYSLALELAFLGKSINSQEGISCYQVTFDKSGQELIVSRELFLDRADALKLACEWALEEITTMEVMGYAFAGGDNFFPLEEIDNLKQLFKEEKYSEFMQIWEHYEDIELTGVIDIIKNIIN